MPQTCSGWIHLRTKHLRSERTGMQSRPGAPWADRPRAWVLLHECASRHLTEGHKVTYVVTCDEHMETAEFDDLDEAQRSLSAGSVMFCHQCRCELVGCKPTDRPAPYDRRCPHCDSRKCVNA